MTKKIKFALEKWYPPQKKESEDVTAKGKEKTEKRSELLKTLTSICHQVNKIRVKIQQVKNNIKLIIFLRIITKINPSRRERNSSIENSINISSIINKYIINIQ